MSEVSEVSTVSEVSEVSTVSEVSAVSAVSEVSAEAEIKSLPPKAARMVAVEILLAEPEELGDDVLESCLYVLREKLRAS